MNLHLSRYAQAYIRGSLYATIAFLTALTAELDPLKELTPDQLGALTWVFWLFAGSKIVLATCITMRAFFDGTMERIASTPKNNTPSTP